MNGVTRLLAVEWMKVKAYRTFWILLGLFVVAVPAVCATYAATAGKVVTRVGLFGTPLAFPQVFETVAWLTSFLTPVMGILLIILLTNEREFRTLRQNVIDGWSRDQVIAAKFGVMICLVLLITLAVAALSLMYGSGPGGMLSGTAFKFLAWSAVQSMAYLSFAFFLGTFLKRSGIAIALYVFYAYLGELVLATLLDAKIQLHAGAYLPLEATDRLLMGGGLRTVRGAMAQQMGQGGGMEPSAALYLCIAAGYILLFGFLSWRRMKRGDL